MYDRSSRKAGCQDWLMYLVEWREEWPVCKHNLPSLPPSSLLLTYTRAAAAASLINYEREFPQSSCLVLTLHYQVHLADVGWRSLSVLGKSNFYLNDIQQSSFLYSYSYSLVEGRILLGDVLWYKATTGTQSVTFHIEFQLAGTELWTVWNVTCLKCEVWSVNHG